MIRQAKIILIATLLIVTPIFNLARAQEKATRSQPEVEISNPANQNPPAAQKFVPNAKNEDIWFDDDIPSDAEAHAEGGDAWDWVSTNPVALSGAKSHQSRNFNSLDTPSTIHRHYFQGTLNELLLDPGDKLFTYVFLDINNMPGEIMLEWKDPRSFEHRAYWGENKINLGTDGTASRFHVGPLPKASTWVRLEVPAKAVGLENASLNGMSFVIDSGRATFDAAGKVPTTDGPPPASAFGDSVWFDEGLPQGARTATVNDTWTWVANLSPFGLAHESFVSISHNTPVYRSHSFTGAQVQMQVNPGDVLFTYVWMDPAAKPDELMLQWFDGSSWEHRAFWGENYIGRLIANIGVQGTESQRYVGGLPPAGAWYRLEVPASYVGLEGKSVSGMAFSLYGKEPTVIWDRSGKAAQSSITPVPLNSTVSIWRLETNDGFYAYDANDQGPDKYFPNKGNVFRVFPNQVGGTVPFYRFRRPNSPSPELFYSQSKSYDGNGWALDGTSFYVFPDGSTTGTVPLYLYHDAQAHYFLTINQSEAGSMSLDGIAAYVYPPKDAAPASPSALAVGFRGSSLAWVDNSVNETGFQIEREEDGWVVVSNLPANTTHFEPEQRAAPCEHVGYRVRAVNEQGFSDSVAGEYGCTNIGIRPENHPPEINLTTANEGNSSPAGLTIVANVFDPDGPGTIAKVELYANGNKLVELSAAPYVFVWSNVAAGTYNLTATATDAQGATASSTLITVTVGEPSPLPQPDLRPLLRPTVMPIRRNPALLQKLLGLPGSQNY